MLTKDFEIFLMPINSKKNIKQVTHLSIIFGINPPGKVVVNPEIKPLVIATRNTLFLSGKRIIAKKAIVSIISGFIPKKNPGIIT